MSAFFIAIEGATGVGKTTLAARLATELDAVAVFDPFDDNPFLPGLLAADRRPDPASALRVELTFLALRLAQLRGIGELLVSGQHVVADWALIKQPIFAATTLDPDDAARVAATLDVWSPSVPQPDLLIGLSAATSVIRQRVCQRGREMEAGLTRAHIDHLLAAFEAAYAVWERPLIRVDANTFNTFHDNHVHELVEQLRQLPLPLEIR